MSATAAFALLLFGCSDDGAECQRLSYPTETFATTAHCEAKVDDAMTSEIADRADAPTVVARCLTAAKAARIGAGPVDLTSPALRPAFAAR